MQDNSIQTRGLVFSVKTIFVTLSAASHFLFCHTLFVGSQADGDLLPKELSDVWDAVPKIENDNLRIDLDSFVQVYRDVDDMFEEDADDDVDDVVAMEEEAIGVEEDNEDDEGDSLDNDLVQIFESISNGDGLLSKDALKAWDEVKKLMNEGLLGEDEFEVLWDSSASSFGKFVNSDGFLAFNVALDDLFDFADEDGNTEDLEDVGMETEMPAARAMVKQGDMPPGVLFANLADDNQLVGMEELELWVELQEMLQEGDLQKAELRDIYNGQASSTPLGKLDEEAFLRLYAEIDNLFEEENDDPDGAISSKTDPEQTKKVKEDLLAFLEIIQEGDIEMLPCGLDAAETDQKQILNIVKALEMQSSNLVKQKEGNIELVELTGTWELLYSSSSAMKFNNGLSGLGGSFPNGRFAGLKQELTVTKVLQDMEYKERIEVNPSSASFDVSVPGSWQLRRSVSLFTGEPSVVVLLEPERVNYG